MRRRDFITLLGGVAVYWPPMARAQQSSKRIGALTINSEEYETDNLAAFRDGLQRAGYIVSQTVQIDYRHADGSMDSLNALARELIQLKPDLALAASTSPVRALKRIAPTLPIVCPAFADIFIPSLATSFAKPGGSVTGIATNVEGLIGKLTELIVDAMPGVARIGFLANPSGASMTQNVQQIRSTARERGIMVQIEEVEKPEDVDGAFGRLKAAQVQAIVVPQNGLLNSRRDRIVELGLESHLPLFFGDRAGVIAGGLASYGVNISENWRGAAIYVDKILKGAKPGDLPIEFPTKIELVINLKTAHAIGLTIPPTLIARADEVIQ